MNIRQINYTIQVPTDYDSIERITLIVEIAADDDLQEIVQELKNTAKGLASERYKALYNKCEKLKNEIFNLEVKLRKKTSEWNATAEFLRSQGIRPEARNMPLFDKLLSPSKEEVFEGEAINNDNSNNNDNDDDSDGGDGGDGGSGDSNNW